MNKFLYLLFLSLLTLGSACKKSKNKPVAEIEVPTQKENYQPITNELLESLDTLPAKPLTFKSKLSISGALQNIDNASLSIRLQRDSLVWISVSALGFEAMRILIDHDQVQILDKFNKVHASLTYNRITEKFGIPINYQFIQSAIVGKRFLDMTPNDLIHAKNDTLLLKQNYQNLSILSTLASERLQLIDLFISDTVTQNKLKGRYSNFQPLSDQLLPYLGLITIESADKKTPGKVNTSEIKLEHLRVDISDEPLTFPFSIPNNYKKVY